MLPGEAAADFNAIANDFGGSFESAFELFGVAWIVENDRMKIAIASMAAVADPKAELITDLFYAAKRLRKTSSTRALGGSAYSG